MQTDPRASIYQEAETVSTEFTRNEQRRASVLLRRLRFLEHKSREAPDIVSGNGGAAYGEFEIEALEWVLLEIGYIKEPSR